MQHSAECHLIFMLLSVIALNVLGGLSGPKLQRVKMALSIIGTLVLDRAYFN
jgi:hypothetical protein